MKSILKYILIVTVLLGAVSCEDFLKEDPKGQLLSNSTFRNKTDLTGSLYALYKQVMQTFNGHIQFCMTNMGDDLTTHPAMNKAVVREFDIMTVSDENANMEQNNTGNWRWRWNIIKAANFIINCPDNIPGASVDDINFVRGQAYYWRAWAYYTLVQFWGPVPILENLSADAVNVKLSKISEVYEFVLSNLEEAEKLVPNNHTGIPWTINNMNVLVNKGAVQATRAYVYMAMAGWPLEYGKDYYTKAAAEAKKVIDGAEGGTYYYKLYPNYRQIHSNAENTKNTELILGVYYNDGKLTETGDPGYATRCAIMDVPQGAGGWNDVSAEVKFYTEFPDGDRKTWTYAPGIALPGGPDPANDNKANNNITLEYVPWWSTKIPVANRRPYSRKQLYTAFKNSEVGKEWDIRKTFALQHNDGWGLQTRQAIRLAEVYLWYAEAVGRAELTGEYTNAHKYLNAVRNRANGNTDPQRDIYSGLDGRGLARAAWNEHGWEIALWWGGPLAPRISDQQRMHNHPDDYYCPMKHYNSRRADYANNIPYIIPDSQKDVYLKDNDGNEVLDGGGNRILWWEGSLTTKHISASDAFGPVEDWDEKKMFLPYPKKDVLDIPCLRDVNKLSLIK